MRTQNLRLVGRRLFVAAFLATTLSVPLTLASAQKVAAACYITWTSSYTASSSVVPATGLLYSASVTYRLGYDTCRLYAGPVQINVQSFRYTMKVTGGRADTIRQDAARSVLEWFVNYPYDYKIIWNEPTLFKHVGDGTWTRSYAPNVYMWYDGNAAIRSYWTGCSVTGVGKCQIWYRFRRGDWTVRWTL